MDGTKWERRIQPGKSTEEPPHPGKKIVLLEQVAMPLLGNRVNRDSSRTKGTRCTVSPATTRVHGAFNGKCIARRTPCRHHRDEGWSKRASRVSPTLARSIRLLPVLSSSCRDFLSPVASLCVPRPLWPVQRMRICWWRLVWLVRGVVRGRIQGSIWGFADGG